MNDNHLNSTNFETIWREELSPKEILIYLLIAQWKDEEIAKRLCIASATVRKHIEKIANKFNLTKQCNKRVELIKLLALYKPFLIHLNTQIIEQVIQIQNQGKGAASKLIAKENIHNLLNEFQYIKKNQSMVKTIANLWLPLVSQHVKQSLLWYLSTAHQVNQSNAEILYTFAELNLENRSLLQRLFWRQIQIFNTLTFVGIGLENKDNLGIEKLDDGRLTLRISTSDSNYNFQTYLINEFGRPHHRLDFVPGIPFDPRTRPWYKVAIKAGRSVWSEIYPNTAGITCYLGASMPYYGREGGQLKGVLLCNINLSQMGIFLQNLQISDKGQVFIIENSGMLVATSTGEKVFTTIHNTEYGAERIEAIYSKNDLTRATAAFLKNNKLQEISETLQAIEFQVEGKKHFLQLQRLQDQFGLDWLIVVVIPELEMRDFQNTKYLIG